MTAGKLILICGVFSLYIVLILVFAAVYFRHFKWRPSSFIFASGIARGQLANRLEEIRSLVDYLDEADSILTSIEAELANHSDRKIETGWQLSSEKGTLRFMSIDVPHSRVASTYPAMVVFSKDNREVYRWSMGERPIWAKEYTTIANLRGKIVTRRTHIAGWRAENLALSSRLINDPIIWTFADFFYFSTIIQSTVGLGDIQPNSTEVSRIVTLQILAGYAVLIVLLNITLTWQ
jgi:hypothetical protein